MKSNFSCLQSSMKTGLFVKRQVIHKKDAVLVFYSQNFINNPHLSLPVIPTSIF